MTEVRLPKKALLVFFRAAAGNEPVRQWLKELPANEKHAVGEDLLRRSGVGRLACRCAVRWEAGYGKFAPTYPLAALPEC
jgi:hypothetical protein